MFTIHAMVGKRRNQINMPRLDAYFKTVHLGFRLKLEYTALNMQIRA